MGSITETNTPQAFMIYGGPKNAGVDHPEMRAIGQLYYLMAGDYQKGAPLAKVIESMSRAMKHVRDLSISAGFDPEYSKAKWVSKRDSEIRVLHAPSTLTNASVPWVDQVAHPGEADADDFDLNDQDDLCDNITRFTNLAATNTQPIIIMKNVTWTEEPCQAATYNIVTNEVRNGQVRHKIRGRRDQAWYSRRCKDAKRICHSQDPTLLCRQ